MKQTVIPKSNNENFDISIIIVSYNSSSIILNCIDSIYKFSEELKIQLIVADNASIDSTVSSVHNRYPEITILQNNKNIGFAAANNRALLFAKGRFVLFLNPDIILLEPVFKQMIEFLDKYQDAGMVSCQLINPDGSIQKSYFNKLPTLWNRFLEAIYVEKLFDKKSRRTIINICEKVQAIVGACIFMKRETAERLEGFDERFFMYCEDIDLSYRIQKLGYNIYVIGNLKMFHYHGASGESRQNYFERVLTKESVYKYFKKHHGKTKAAMYKVLMVVGSIVRIIVLFTWVPITIVIGKSHYFDYSTSISKYVRVFFWGLGFEKWTKSPG